MQKQRLMMKSMQINAILTHQLKVKANDGGFGLNTPMAKAIDDERKAVGWKCKEDVANIAGIGPKTMKCLEKAGAFEMVYYLVVEIDGDLFMHRGYCNNEEAVQAMYRHELGNESALQQRVWGHFRQQDQLWEGETITRLRSIYTSGEKVLAKEMQEADLLKKHKSGSLRKAPHGMIIDVKPVEEKKKPFPTRPKAKPTPKELVSAADMILAFGSEVFKKENFLVSPNYVTSWMDFVPFLHHKVVEDTTFEDIDLMKEILSMSDLSGVQTDYVPDGFNVDHDSIPYKNQEENSTSSYAEKRDQSAEQQVEDAISYVRKGNVWDYTMLVVYTRECYHSSEGAEYRANRDEFYEDQKEFHDINGRWMALNNKLDVMEYGQFSDKSCPKAIARLTKQLNKLTKERNAISEKFMALEEVWNVLKQTMFGKVWAINWWQTFLNTSDMSEMATEEWADEALSHSNDTSTTEIYLTVAFSQNEAMQVHGSKDAEVNPNIIRGYNDEGTLALHDHKRRVEFFEVFASVGLYLRAWDDKKYILENFEQVHLRGQEEQLREVRGQTKDMFIGGDVVHLDKVIHTEINPETGVVTEHYAVFKEYVPPMYDLLDEESHKRPREDVVGYWKPVWSHSTKVEGNRNETQVLIEAAIEAKSQDVVRKNYIALREHLNTDIS